MMIWIPRIVENRIRLIRNKKYVFLWNRQIRKRNTLMILINLFRQLIEQLIKVKSNVQHIFSSLNFHTTLRYVLRINFSLLCTRYSLSFHVNLSRESITSIHSSLWKLRYYKYHDRFHSFGSNDDRDDYNFSTPIASRLKQNLRQNKIVFINRDLSLSLSLSCFYYD